MRDLITLLVRTFHVSWTVLVQIGFEAHIAGTFLDKFVGLRFSKTEKFYEVFGWLVFSHLRTLPFEARQYVATSFILSRLFQDPARPGVGELKQSLTQIGIEKLLAKDIQKPTVFGRTNKNPWCLEKKSQHLVPKSQTSDGRKQLGWWTLRRHWRPSWLRSLISNGWQNVWERTVGEIQPQNSEVRQRHFLGVVFFFFQIVCESF